MLIHFSGYGFLIGISLLAILLPILWWRKHNYFYLLSFTIFWMYLLFVVRTVIFPIAINLDTSSGKISPDINLIPLYIRYCSTLTKYCAIEVVGNTILTIPFGFGINFLVHVKPRKILRLALVVGFGFELSQLIISIIFKTGFRTVDINDALLNAIGVLLGYALFRIFAWLYLKITAHSEITRKWPFAEIYKVVYQEHISEKS